MRGIRLSRRTAIVATASTVAALAGIVTPRRSLFLLGDSWAAGLYADPQRALGQVAAAGLGWAATVDAVSGTGYVNGEAELLSYPERAAVLPFGTQADIAVVQGGSNDRSATSEELVAAAVRTLDLLRERLPSARVVMLGPGPDPEPVTRDQWAVDHRLGRVARTARVPYVSMLRRRWITGDAAAQVLDPVNHHPTVAGQAYLGHRLELELRRLYPELTDRAARR